MHKRGYVYFMTNKSRNVLYVGVTSNLVLRVIEHKAKLHKGFTKKYNCSDLVYFEDCESIADAIAREKQLKNWKREWKNELISRANSNWEDLSCEIGITDKMVMEIAGQARNDEQDMQKRLKDGGGE